MTLQKRPRITSWRETRETICNSASDWSMGKAVKKIKIFFTFFYFLHCFSNDQSEAELLYFCSLFFSVKKPFKKTKVFFLQNLNCENVRINRDTVPSAGHRHRHSRRHRRVLLL
jgi:hypothetical protein